MKTVVISVTVAFPLEPTLVVDIPDTLTNVELLGAGAVDVRLVYHAEASYAEVV